jgi:uncharacterized protein (DUF924 family)
MNVTPADAAALLDLWLGPEADRDAPAAEVRKRWFEKSAAFDAQLAQGYGELLERAGRGELDVWAATARGRVALVILCDQLGRNLGRGSAAMFAHDPRALDLARQGLAPEVERSLRGSERYFLYMPFMHSESIADQDRSVELFAQLARDYPSLDGRTWAQSHRDIVARFGRFPHRNALLGRRSTPQEEAFLEQPGSSF